MFLAWKEIKHEKTRFILIIAIIILVSYLTYFLVGLSYGLASSYTDGISKWNADGIVIPQDANGTIGRSRMTEDDIENISAKEKATLGIANVVVQNQTNNDNTHIDACVFGVEIGSFLLPDITDGNSVTNSGEIVVDSSLKDVGYKIGDTLEMSDIKLKPKIVGFTEKATYQTLPLIYMTTSDWRVLLQESMQGQLTSEYVSATIVRNDGDIKDILPAKTNLAIQSIGDFYFTLPGYKPQVLTFGLMIGFLIFISSFVLGIFIYILTLQKKSMFGVLKAQGITNSTIGFSVVCQTIILAAIGLTIGLALTLLSGFLLRDKVPFVIQPVFFLIISSLFILFANIGALFSVRAVTKIDPIVAIG